MRVILVWVSPLLLSESSSISPGSTILAKSCVLDVIRKSTIIETTNCTPDHTPSHFSLSTEDLQGKYCMSFVQCPLVRKFHAWYVQRTWRRHSTTTRHFIRCPVHQRPTMLTVCTVRG